MALIAKEEKMDKLLEHDHGEVVDLTGKGIRKLEKYGYGNARSLVLDKNELIRLENLESYGDIRKLSAADNKLVRMYGVCRLINLEVLNLANNTIVAIEGLRELIHLKWLKLSGNKIKTIEYFSSNIELEYLDLSNNCISSLVNLSHLKVLHTLLLDYNELRNLNNASNYLPASLTGFSVAGNLISDLNQVSFLGNFQNLEQFSIVNNPCVDMTGNAIGFDYRPFIINWCHNLKLLDGFVIGSKESLKAEWLYSMGKGRHFQLDEHVELTDYLAGVCPLTNAENLMTEEDAKLNRILSKRKQHQQQLLEEMASGNAAHRPSTAPVMINSCTVNSSTLVGTSPGLDRSKSAASLRSNAFLSSLPASHQPSKSHSPTRHWAAFKSKKKSDAAEKCLVEFATAHYELNSHQHDFQDPNLNSFMSLLPEAPSDVPEMAQFSLDIDAPASVMPLRSETQYVPVPETMLSPDFRPVTTSPHCRLFDAGIGSDAHASSFEVEAVHSRWLQRSSIPRVAATYSVSPSSSSSPKHLSCRDSDARPHHRPIRNSATDSPLLKRPTQIQKLQKTSRPLSLSPSCGRRSPTTQKKPISNHAKNVSSSSSDDSTDSDVSLSKLSLVKEVAQTKLDAIVRKSMESSMEEQSLVMVSSDSLVQLSHSTSEKTKGKTLSGERKCMEKPLVQPCCNDDKDQQSKLLQKAATVIQSAWRGFRVRNYDFKTVNCRQEIRVRRAEDHVRILQDQLVKTQKELECEKRLRMLQMEAIRALWKEVQDLQVTDASKAGREFITPSDSGIESPIITSNVIANNSTSKNDNQRFTDNLNEGCKMSGNSVVPLSASCLFAASASKNAKPAEGFNVATENANFTLRVSHCPSSAADFSKCDVLASHLLKQNPSHTNARMISHLFETCNSLQNQVHQFQEALQMVSCAMSESDLEGQVTNQESMSQMVTQMSSPFVSAAATPVTNESNSSIVSAANRANENESATTSLSDDDRLFSEKSSPENNTLCPLNSQAFSDCCNNPSKGVFKSSEDDLA